MSDNERTNEYFEQVYLETAEYFIDGVAPVLNRVFTEQDKHNCMVVISNSVRMRLMFGEQITDLPLPHELAMTAIAELIEDRPYKQSSAS
ncbi:hypothetical protein V5T82_15380 [Magnetovibrio sp. PR-2]|uniref:hypothetical protein n=1 Tax=Magnetovibrio sp. PR-2 TaxID=3120356 RepID=UPI002FCE1657